MKKSGASQKSGDGSKKNEEPSKNLVIGKKESEKS